MNTEQKRVALLSAYPGPKWVEKVKKMSEQQVIATYLRLQRAGKI